MNELDQLYTELIMEHNTSKQNRYTIDNADFVEHGHNPNCGDDIDLYVKFSGDVIADLSFTGAGCAISQASTSIMIDLLKHKTKEEAQTLINLFISMIQREQLTEDQLDQLEDAAAFQNICNMPARVKCAVLAWHTLDDVIAKS